MMRFRWLLPYGLLFLAITANAQEKEKLYFSTGVSIPTGNDLSSVFDFGLDLGVGKNFFVSENLFINPQAVCVYYINNPNSSVRDNFFQFGAELKVGYRLMVGQLEVRPQLGVGYLWGTDFITSKKGDFDKRWLFGPTETLLNTQSVTGIISADALISPKVRLGVTYRLQRPMISLDEKYQNAFPSYNTSTSLYGKVVEFPDQRFNFDSISLNVYFIIR